jgi:hypothetical protein
MTGGEWRGISEPAKSLSGLRIRRKCARRLGFQNPQAFFYNNKADC